MNRLFLYLTILLTLLVGVNTEGFAQMKGKATYYHNRFHGRLTSDGSVYHKDSLTCAHKTLPFGTVLRVVNKKNGREVVVTVNDRGPFRPNTMLDLSYAAAKELDMLHDGVIVVAAFKLTPLDVQHNRHKPLRLPDLKIVETMKSSLMRPVAWG